MTCNLLKVICCNTIIFLVVLVREVLKKLCFTLCIVRCNYFPYFWIQLVVIYICRLSFALFIPGNQDSIKCAPYCIFVCLLSGHPILFVDQFAAFCFVITIKSKQHDHIFFKLKGTASIELAPYCSKFTSVAAMLTDLLCVVDSEFPSHLEVVCNVIKWQGCDKQTP